VRLFVKFPEIEKRVWAKLPLPFRQPREEFDEKIVCRNKTFLSKLKKQLKQIGYTSVCKAELKGDWHVTGCTTLVSTINNTQKSAIKQRNGGLESFITKILNQMACDIHVRLHIPEITSYEDFYIQNYIETTPHEYLDSRSVGALIGFSLIFGIFDLHDENIIESLHGLSLIDLECAFLMERGLKHENFILSNGLLYDDQSRIKSSFLFSRIESINEDELKKGWNLALDYLLENQHTIDFERIDSFKCRRVLAGTAYYTKILQRRYAYIETEIELKANLLRHAKFRGIATPKIIDAEIAQLSEWNIPYFYQMNGCLYSSHQETPISSRFPIRNSLRRRFSCLAAISLAKRNNLLIKVLQKFKAAKNLA